MKRIQYTLRDVDPRTDAYLRKRAREAGKSLNEAAKEALDTVAGTTPSPKPLRDLSWFIGSMKEDPVWDEVLEDMGRIDPEDWK
jgi:hypothetical protein